MPGSVGFAKSLGNTSMQYPTNLDDTAGGAINFSNNASIPRPPFTLLTPEEDNLEDVHFMMVGYHQRQKTIVSNIEYKKKSKKWKKGKGDENGMFLPSEKRSNVCLYAEEVDIISK